MSEPVSSDESAITDELTIEEKLEVHELNQLAGPVHMALLSAIEATDLMSFAYARTSRIKSPERIFKKILLRRNKQGEPDFALRDVRDVVGIRIICLFREDIIRALDIMCDLVAGNLSVAPNPFERSAIEEATVYSSESPGDVSQIAVRARSKIEEKLHGLTTKACEIVTRQDYSSVHIVTKARATESNSDQHLVPIEIQIRSIFEDAWAQIDHKLRYSVTREQNTEARVDVKAQSELHLKVLKHFLDACASHADILYREATVSTVSSNTTIRTIDGAVEFSNCADHVKISSRLAEELLQIMYDKADVDEQIKIANRGKDTTKKHYRELRREYAIIAEKYSDIYEREIRDGGYISALKLNNDDSAAYFYFIRMEEALARLLVDDPGEVTTAVSIYRDLALRFPTYPIAHLRVGEAEGQLGNHSASILALEKCLKLSNERRMEPEENRLIFLSDNQISYVDEHIHRLIGFRYWRRADSIREDLESVESVLKDIQKAYQVTRTGLEIEMNNENTRLINNALYFAVDEREYAKLHSLDQGNGVSDDEIRALLEKITNLLEGEDEEGKDPMLLDTVSRAYEALKEENSALVYAKAAMDEVQTANTVTLSAFRREAYERIARHSWRLIGKSGAL